MIIEQKGTDNMNYTEQANEVLRIAKAAAKELHHPYVGTEHLLLGLRKVYTGVAVLDFDGNGKRHTISHAEETKVYVHEMTDEEIRRYIAAGESMDKAGAYGVQGRFAAYIDRIEGDYYNVVGLPVAYLYHTVKEL